MSVVEAREIWKAFSGTVALKGASLSLAQGSIHALIGENGAGKSTLIKVLTGVHKAPRMPSRGASAPSIRNATSYRPFRSPRTSSCMHHHVVQAFSPMTP